MSIIDDLMNPTQQTSNVSTIDQLMGMVGTTQDPLAAPPQPEEPRGILDSVLDVLARGQYVSAKFFDSLVNDSNATFTDALSQAGSELLNPQSRLSFSDVITRSNPDFAKEHPIATTALGLVGDVALDPLTWLTFGYGAATKLGTTGKLLNKVGREVFKEEIQKQLPKAAGDFAVARELAEEAVGNAISAGRSELLANFKIAGIPIAKQGAVEKAFGVLWDNGPKQAVDLLRKVPVLKQAVAAGEWLGGAAFNVAKDLPKEYMNVRSDLIAEWAKGAERTKNTLKKLFLDYTDEEIDAVEKLHQHVYDKTRRFYDDAYNVGIASGLDDAAAKTQALNGVRGESTRIWDTEFTASGLDPKLKAMSGVMRQEYQEIGRRLQQAGLLDDLVENYHPLIFDFMSDRAKLKEYFDYVRNPFLPAAKERTIKTFEEARQWATKKGIDIETNAIKLYTLRALQAEKALAYQQFKDNVKGIGFDLDALPKRIAEDMRFLGDGDYGSGLTEAGRIGLKAWDKTLNAFRGMATFLKPSFALKQASSNSLQAYLTLGPKAFRFFDPRTRLDAFHVLAHQSGYGDAQKFLGSKITSTLGEEITGDQLIKELADMNVIRGTNMGGGGVERTARSLKQEIDRERFIHRKFGKDYEGLAKLMIGTANYTNWPSIIEDFSRTNLYINGRRAGLSAREAAAKVDQSLFDYVHGLSSFERRVMRRIVPFYSFQRFMVPLLGKTLLTEPGRIANIGKTSRDFMEVWNKLDGGEELTQSERAVLPGWLLDQPFAKMDADRQAMFRVLSNFNPLDVMGMVEVDSGGEINMEKTLQSAVLAQLAPLLKMPFELALNRNVFTGRAIAGQKSSGKIGDVSASGVFSNMLAAIMAGQRNPLLGLAAGAPGLLAGKAAGEMLPDQAARWLANAIGWEEAFDPRTSKTQVYINPYLAYVATSQFPILSQAIRFDRYNEAEHPFERWMDLIMGVPTTRTNLRDSYRFAKNEDKMELSDLKREMRLAYVQGRTNKYEEARAELMKLLEEYQARYSAIDTGDIRGF